MISKELFQRLDNEERTWLLYETIIEIKQRVEVRQKRILTVAGITGAIGGFLAGLGRFVGL